MEHKTYCFCVIGFIIVHVNAIYASEVLSVVEWIVVATDDSFSLSAEVGMITVGAVACKTTKISLNSVSSDKSKYIINYYNCTMKYWIVNRSCTVLIL